MTAAARVRKAVIQGEPPDLAARDPEFIRSQLPGMWVLASLYFRAEVHGLDRIPEDRPVWTPRCSAPAVCASTPPAPSPADPLPPYGSVAADSGRN